MGGRRYELADCGGFEPGAASGPAGFDGRARVFPDCVLNASVSTGPPPQRSSRAGRQTPIPRCLNILRGT